MKNKLINIVLNIITFIVPLAVLPTGIFPDNYNLPKLIILGFCGISLFILLFLKRKELKFDNIDKVLLGFYLLICISTIFSINIKQAVFGVFNRWEGMLMFGIYFLSYYASKYYFKTYKNFFNIMFLVVSINCIIGILQYYNVPYIHELFGYTSFSSGTFGNRNFMGSFVTIFLPLIMCLYILKGKKKYLVFSSIFFLGILVSLTRSAWLAFFIYSLLGILFLFIQKNKTFYKNAIVLFSLFLILFTGFIFMDNGLLNQRKEATLKEIKSDASSFGSGRGVIWQISLRAIADNPILGTGPDTLNYNLCYNYPKELLEDVIPKAHGVPDKAHNEFLNIAVTIGLPALGVYLIFLTLIFNNLLKNNIFKDYFSFIFIMIIIGYLVQSFFNISTIGVAPIFWIVLGLSQNSQFKKELIL